MLAKDWSEKSENMKVRELLDEYFFRTRLSSELDRLAEDINNLFNTEIESLKAETAVMKSILSDIFYGHILTGQTDFEDELEERIKKILEIKVKI